jgi:type I restriction enzyme S subunit
LKEQEKIAGALESISDSIKACERKRTQQASIKKALMQDLLTGKVRVKVD